MARYFTNELSFELPRLEHEDRTLHLFESTEAGGTIGLAVARSRAPSAALDVAVTAELARRAAELDRHEVLERRARRLDDHDAIDVADRFRLHGALVFRRSLHVVAGAVWLHVSASGPVPQRAHCDRLVEALALSMRLRPDLP